MEGPTPVSALIHAATMVAAGVYMLARVSFLILPTPDAQTVIAGVGAVTALFAALVATQQDDIKRILAYSTLSQLGYMIMAIGLRAPGAAMFHLFTHAFFKALLFLGAGADHLRPAPRAGYLENGRPAHAHEVDVLHVHRRLRSPSSVAPSSADSSPRTTSSSVAYERNIWFFIPGLLTAFLTAFYMTRLYVVVFFGKARTAAAGHGHDGPPAMTGPLHHPRRPFRRRRLWHAPITSSPAPRRCSQSHRPALAITAFVVGASFPVWLLYKGQASDPIVIPPLQE